MAQSPPKKPRRTRTRTTCFSGCFGPRHSDEVSPPSKTRPNGGEKLKISWFYWSRFRLKKSAAKTVPVEASAAALVDSTIEAEKKAANDKFTNSEAEAEAKSKSKSKSKSKPDRISSKTRPAKQATATEAVRPAQPPESEGGRETSEREAEGHRNDTRENRTDAARGNTWHNQKRLSFRRRIDAIRAGSSQPGSPEVKPAKPSRSSAAAVAIPHSASLPILDPEPRPALPRPTQPQKNRKARPASGPSGDEKRVDPVVGMSIIMVTLVIMILWGRLCAILCTAVWFYFIPRLRSATERPVSSDGPNPNRPDLNSEEYKKRVVLEGLLERNRRSPS
ncbi:uncharacterized protein J3R85_012900 [Psidium guajava]|nr:uncharacterized protein J3R85_012900 [Psidium guajava]